jgi:hypothetical protein
MDIIKEFNDYKSKIGDRKSLYDLVAKTYHVKRALYPGSHIDISPSFVIPNMIYIDNFKGSIKFFEKNEEIIKYVDDNKHYQEECKIEFYGNDYRAHLDIKQVDLIISQYAGFVGQATKKYLKKGGILLANDSHGDATLAHLDEDFELIAIINRKGLLSTVELQKYFKFSRERLIDEVKVRQTMKGPKYQYQAPNYIFRLK